LLLSGTPSLNDQIHRIYYFSTPEGLVSHFFQLQNLWFASLPYHNSIKFIVVPWSTPHFPGVLSVSLCDYFVLPEVFSCEENRPYYRVAKSLPSSTVCELMNAKNMSWGTNPEMYQLKPEQVKIVDRFHFDQKPSCIGGYLGLYSGVTSANKESEKEVIMPWKFRHEYLNLVNVLKRKTEALSSNRRGYVVVHWRRGDQLTSNIRCGQPRPLHVTTGTSRPIDTSVNCGSVETFIVQVREQVHRLIEVPFNYSSPIPVYVATNENNPTILDKLAKESFILGHHFFGEQIFNNGRLKEDTGNNNQMTPLSFNTAETYVMELILMCKSRFLFLYGASSTSLLIQQCRHLLPMFNSSTSSMEKVTFHNGVRMNSVMDFPKHG
jgi:hypothetical protein